MSIQSLTEYYNTNGKEKTIELLKTPCTITEKINAHRVYCKKEKTGNVLFFTKKKSQPISIIDRVLSDLYEPFIKHIIRVKDKLDFGEYGFYLMKNPVDINYSKKPINYLLLTDIPPRTEKTWTQVAIELEVSYVNPIHRGILQESQINGICSYLESNEEKSILKCFNSIFNKNCSPFSNEIDIIEGFVFDFYKDGIYKLEDKQFKRTEFPKLNTGIYELLIIEIFDFLKRQDFATVKLLAKNEQLKKVEFIFEIFNRFIEEHGTDIENYIIEPPQFMQSKGKIGRRYINNEKTLDHIKDPKLEYLLRIFLTILKEAQKPRGIITSELNEEHNQIILKINDYVNQNTNLLDYAEFRKFSI